MQNILYRIILLAGIIFISFVPKAHALEGDFEVGAAPGAFIMPGNDTYGGGLEIFGRYGILDSLQVGGGVGAYGVNNHHHKKNHGIYTLRVGAIYALDILNWVPSAGIFLSSLFSESHLYDFHRHGHGLGADFDIQIQYRGIKHIGMGVFFSYHLVFKGTDYMTAGLMISWNSGEF